MSSWSWDGFVEAARALGWFAYLGTADAAGEPHVSVVSPGFTDDRIWFATRASSRKARNLGVRPSVFLHWPVGGPGPGELIARGRATLHMDEATKRRIWDGEVLPYDPATFFGEPSNPDLVFVEVEPTMARLIGPDFRRHVWTP